MNHILTRSLAPCISLFLAGFVLNQYLNAQGVTIGSNNPPDPSAILDLQSVNSGLAIPRINTAQRNAIPNPVFGLQIYNTDTDCMEMFFSSGGWKPVQCGCNAFPNAVFNITQAFINNPATFHAPAPNMTYSWTFQNGSPASAITQSPQVTWSNAGTYAVSLTATDSAGCTSTHTDSVIVSICQPSTWNFTTCGQSGQSGPSQTQCNNTYGSGVVTVSGGMQLWTVPATGNYRIEVAGARGGGPSGYGNGAIMRADFSLTAGTVLKILVGQMGGSSNNTHGSAGGGSFVTLTDNTPLIIAGGGGGKGSGSNAAMANGSTSNAGQTPQGGGPGGTNGGGGAAASGTVGGTGTSDGAPSTGSTWASGGGGLLSNGGIYNGGSSLGGRAFINGGLGGAAASNANQPGGFGGGGGAGDRGAGAGGYSGGGGATDNNYSGGGGGSFIATTATNAATSNGQYNGSNTFNGLSVTNLNAYNSNHGYVTISRICP